MKKNKTIAIFSGFALPHLGGVEKYTDCLKNELLKKNIKVIIVTSNYSNLKTKEIIDNTIYYRLPVFNIFKNRYPIIKKNKEYRKIISELSKANIDRIIVNTRFYLTSHVGANFGKKYNIPVYLIEHGSNYVTLDNKILDFIANRYEDFLTSIIKRKIKGFYGVSDACGNWLKKFNIKTSGTWYNSIDVNQKNLPKKTHDTINFLYAGRLIKQKGVENILISFKILEKKYNNIKLYIAGDGPELDNYKDIYKSKNIVYLGKLDYEDLKKYYAITDIFLYPPLWPEGLPTSILEAGLMKCAVIATNQGGIVEIIKDKYNGLLIDTKYESLKNAMETFINDEKLRKKCIDKLYNDIKDKFSWETTANKILDDITKK